MEKQRFAPEISTPDARQPIPAKMPVKVRLVQGEERSERYFFSSGDSGGPMVLDQRGPDGKCELIHPILTKLKIFFPSRALPFDGSRIIRIQM